MSAGVKLSADLQHRILETLRVGTSQSETARMFNISRSVVSRIWAESTLPRNRHGQPSPVLVRKRRLDLSWQDDAACNAYPTFTEWPSARDQQAICADCTVKAPCVEQAISDGPPFAAVHGGLPIEELHRLYDRRSR